ncbi:MAG: dTDP-4-dehydrorhamnose 3,5-epimerase [Brevinematia bacterium]
MEVIETGIPGLIVFKLDVYEDNRGYFFESYNSRVLEKAGIRVTFVQDNQSGSKYGVLRGLHYQVEPFAQSKLVRVIRGKVWDVAVDLRKNSPTYKKYFGMELSESNRLQFFIPKGFAHGFVVLSEFAEFFYKCDNYYNREADRGIRFDDPEIGIEWPLDASELILSEKDKNLPLLKDAELNFVYGGE